MRNKRKLIANQLFALKLIFEASRSRIFIQTMVTTLDSLLNLLFGVFTLRYIINSVQEGKTFINILVFLLVLLGLRIIFNLFKNYYNEIYVPISNEKVNQYIQMKIFKKSASIDIECYEKADFYDLYVKASNETLDKIWEVLNCVSRIFSLFISISTVSFVIFLIDPIFLVCVLFSLLIKFIFGSKLNKTQYEYDMEKVAKTREVDYVKRVFYLQDYAKELKMTEINKVLFHRFINDIRELKKLNGKYGYRIAMLSYIIEFSNEVVIFLGSILYCAFKIIVTQSMLLGDGLFIINSINSVSYSFQDLTDFWLSFQKQSFYIGNLRSFLSYQSKICDFSKAKIPPVENHILTINNLYFRYSGNDDYALQDINLTIKTGEKIALVGVNGSGKTTLVKLLMRLYDPYDGNIQLNGNDIRTYNLEKYRELFATVFQDFKIFAFSVEKNITMGNEKIKDDNVDEALKNSDLFEKVITMYDKKQSILTREFVENGIVLSGGEKQKLAIARAFAQNSSFIILDEPSSELDPIAEYKMYENMLNVCKDKAVVFISHRLSSAVLADKIYLLDNGRILEQGTHHELMKLNGYYADMFLKQAKQYI